MGKNQRQQFARTESRVLYLNSLLLFERVAKHVYLQAHARTALASCVILSLSRLLLEYIPPSYSTPGGFCSLRTFTHDATHVAPFVIIFFIQIFRPPHLFVDMVNTFRFLYFSMMLVRI